MRERLHARVPSAFSPLAYCESRCSASPMWTLACRRFTKLIADVETTILAGAGEIELHFKSRAPTLEAAQARVDEVAGSVEEELDDAVYSRNGESLEQIVGYWLQMRNATLAVAESCTGGMLGERITSVGGSSRYFPAAPSSMRIH